VLLFELPTGGVRREFISNSGPGRALGFSPDGRHLFTAHNDHSVLIWDVSVQSARLPNALQNETNLTGVWQALSSKQADVAHLAQARLAREPAAVVKIARSRLLPPSPQALARILEKLGDENFATRERTSDELDRYGEIAVDPVRERISTLASPEARARCEAFVKKFTGPVVDVARLTDIRVIELLEALGTDESRALLKEVAAGAADVFRTQEAKRAIERSAKP
jgi:hypothetical protein